MKKVVLILSLTLLMIGCAAKIKPKTNADYKNEIAKAEKEFKMTVAEKGISAGFYHFADENATIKRERDTLITGRENIRNYYSHPKYKNAFVTWSPDFISVSESGDLAYTYGKYIWTIKDSIGSPKTFKGVFHTVWKRQSDGSWKYVWD